MKLNKKSGFTAYIPIISIAILSIIASIIMALLR